MCKKCMSITEGLPYRNLDRHKCKVSGLQLVKLFSLIRHHFFVEQNFSIQHYMELHQSMLMKNSRFGAPSSTTWWTPNQASVYKVSPHLNNHHFSCSQWNACVLMNLLLPEVQRMNKPKAHGVGLLEWELEFTGKPPNS